ncbi:MAG TPA: DUF2325 domain-containing protein [Candidatus Syntrophoarchaeum butanivorans]|uniref:DUF2325 domain-containing protein n=1 Tax=Candidatus Syntropharchaeum butanivorans TaxID=1839936 RepID=A0A1F2P348_9EURY|nr:MAG: hypothetical protein SBU_001460 [Candidatus Syntrophoarchaeum butanivorans]HEC56811.1 DUF2325 domain-containing protein [Candidatus Syntrophoarchaeum butanivorans]
MRIWDIQPALLCTILGMTMESDATRKILKRFRIEMKGDASSFSMHQELLRQSLEENKLAEFLEKKLDKRFRPYERRIDAIGRDRILETIEDGRGIEGVPLTALIWYLLRSSGEGSFDVELRLFKAMHMIGHRMMRLYDVLSADLPDGSLVEDELWKLKSRVESLTEVNERLERNLARLRRKYDAIQHEFEALKAEKIRIQRELERERGLSANLRNRLTEIERNNSLDQLERLRQENSLLLDEVKRLREELREVSDKERIPEVRPVEVKKKHTDDLPVNLEGVKVALIGGVEGLVPHYREVAESFGCKLCYHGGHCREKDEIERIVEGVDVVFCPVDINSHNASRYAKKACKKRGKPCYFLKSSGLSSLKRGLETFAKATA